MTVFEAALLGLVQGLFMFVPVSSTSHLVLTQHWLASRGSSLGNPASPELILFDLVVHVGTLLSIAFVFRRSLASLVQRVTADVRARVSQAPSEGLYLRLAGLGVLSVVVTGVVGLAFRDVFAGVFAHPLAVVVTLVLTGLVLWWTDVLGPRWRGLHEITPSLAVAVGLAQGLALMPGLSRSGMTIAIALFFGLQRRWAAEYSFFIAIPTILAGTGAQYLLERDLVATVSLAPLAVGFVVAAVVGTGALLLVLHLLYKARLRIFSVYVWALAAVVALSSVRGIASPLPG
jgi:undecaprenyl-diphosphatase